MEILETIIIHAVPLLLAITLHEAAHGFVADRFGDPTARTMGRLSLNPLRHIDPIGTIVVPFVLFVTQIGMLFGWARPVPVNLGNLKRPRLHGFLVAFAGPGSNLLQVLFWAGMVLVLRFGLGAPGDLAIQTDDPLSRVTVPLILIARAGMRWNYWLALLNLLPIPPLDGGRMVGQVLPAGAAAVWGRIEPFGILIVFGVLYLLGTWFSVLFAPLTWLDYLVLTW